MNTHEFDRTVLGLRVTFLRVLASVKSMTRSHRLYRAVNKVNFCWESRGEFPGCLAVKVPVPIMAWLCTCRHCLRHHKRVHSQVTTYKRCGTDMMTVKRMSRYGHVYFTMGLQHNCGQFTLTMFWKPERKSPNVKMLPYLQTWWN